MKKFLCVFVLVTALSAVDVFACDSGMTMKNNEMTEQARNDGSYTRTQQSVTVHTESGHSKGIYAIYLHQGKRYINFNNTWICIQGKSRFFYNGNWYVIK